ncbi:hypothetical protein [Lacticaseibacillus kribbianus]|uniref:hypothetical protein n=1 Tax=Lacticaseibacillus kribbianus TaxID=2926292 RepID=UPI001CD5ADD8|nr:hypothetical protein [Lacticaseibacillus kribbianus]
MVLTPPGTKDGKWDAVIYLDPNAALRDGDRPAYVQRLNVRSRRTLKLRAQDLR